MVYDLRSYAAANFLQGRSSPESCAVFYLDAPSASVCLLIQLEKPATEEGGVTPSVYSRKEPVSVTACNFSFGSLIYFLTFMDCVKSKELDRFFTWLGPLIIYEHYYAFSQNILPLI